MTARCTLALVALLWAAPAIQAQAGEVIQLPTFGFTTVNTTVTAPDGGTVLLGGIDRVAEGSTERGVPILGKVPGLNRLFKNRGIGRSMSASTMTVVPRIIILEEEEERQVGRVLAERRAFAEAPTPPPFAASDLYRAGPPSWPNTWPLSSRPTTATRPRLRRMLRWPRPSTRSKPYVGRTSRPPPSEIARPSSFSSGGRRPKRKAITRRPASTTRTRAGAPRANSRTKSSPGWKRFKTSRAPAGHNLASFWVPRTCPCRFAVG